MRSAAKYIWIFLIVAFVGGFLLVETSGLLGRTPLTATTPVATVNGRDILYTDWYQRVQRQLEGEQQRAGRSLTQDEVRQIEDGVLDQMVMEMLLEQYYRSEIPRQKLLEQLASGVYVTDSELWRSYQDAHDSAQVSYVAFRPPRALRPDTTISEAELRRYFDAHKSEFERQGRAWLSVVPIYRTVSAADSAAIRARAAALRAEIV